MNLKEFGLEISLSAEDDRYPTLVIEGDFGIVGYSVNKSNGTLERVCLCNAHSSSECGCGAWDVDLEPETESQYMLTTIDNGEIIEQVPISEEEMEKFDEQAFEGIEPEPELEPLEAIPISTEVMQGILNNFAFSVNAALRGRAPTPGYTVTMMVPANGQYIFESIANRLEELEAMRKDAERYRFLRDPGRWNSSGGSFVTLTRLSLGDFDNFVDKLIKIEINRNC